MKNNIKKLPKKQFAGAMTKEDSTLGYFPGAPAGSTPLTTEQSIGRREAFRNAIASGDYTVGSKRVPGAMNTYATAKKILDEGFSGSGYGRAGRVRMASDITGLPKDVIRDRYPSAVGGLLRNIGSGTMEAFNGCFPGAKPGSCKAPSRKKGGSLKRNK
jgi:hypothetical protein